MLKRSTDIAFSFAGLVILSPFLLVIGVWILLDAGWPVLFRQGRVGKHNKEFKLLKFRTMYSGSETKGQLTIGARDARVTRSGHFLRRFKLDELPQLWNVLAGDMSLVGPRPEVRKYVSLYNKQQLLVLSVRPGITDYASLDYVDESVLLGSSPEPEKTYIETIMPAKLELNLRYIADQSFLLDMKIIIRTVFRVLFR